MKTRQNLTMLCALALLSTCATGCGTQDDVSQPVADAGTDTTQPVITTETSTTTLTIETTTDMTQPLIEEEPEEEPDISYPLQRIGYCSHYGEPYDINGYNLSEFYNGYALICTGHNFESVENLFHEITCVDEKGHARFRVQIQDMDIYQYETHSIYYHDYVVFSKVEHDALSLCYSSSSGTILEYQTIDVDGNVTFTFTPSHDKTGEESEILAYGGGYVAIHTKRNGFDSSATLIQIYNHAGEVAYEWDIADAYNPSCNYCGDGIFMLKETFEDSVYVDAETGKIVTDFEPDEDGNIVRQNAKIKRQNSEFTTQHLEATNGELTGWKYFDGIYYYNGEDEIPRVYNDKTGDIISFEAYKGKVRRIFLSEDDALYLELNGADGQLYYALYDLVGKQLIDVTLFPGYQAANEYQMLAFNKEQVIFQSRTDQSYDKPHTQLIVSVKDKKETCFERSEMYYDSNFHSNWARFCNQNGYNYISPTGKFLFPYEENIYGGNVDNGSTPVIEMKQKS